ncbi:MAG: glycosyltransferase [Nitrospira sp.]|nr:glycosyltransferase [Nitrospira sp.]
MIVVDGGSSGGTHVVLSNFGFQRPSPLTPHPSRRLLAAPKGRASQMNAGAMQAKGEWLLFLHADTILPDGAIRQLNDMEADQSIQAGGFMHQFSGDDWRLRLISCLDNFRCVRSRIIYGDQALFVRRTLFNQLGGFPNRPFLEDVAFCEKLIKETGHYRCPQVHQDGHLAQLCPRPSHYSPCGVPSACVATNICSRCSMNLASRPI